MHDAQRHNEFWSQAAAPTAAHLALQSQLAHTLIEHAGRGTLLDVGCGEGHLVAELVRQGVDAQGVDLSLAAIRRAPPAIASRLQVASARQLPFADQSFQTVTAIHLLEQLSPAEIAPVLAELYRVSRRTVLLRIHTQSEFSGPLFQLSQNRAAWEKLCFEAGFRKHPAYYHLHDYESLQQDATSILIPLEKIAPSTLQQYPLACLAEERGLHMDMLRESGSRSDAHVIRYQVAADYVRVGDRVLDAACGLGYGSHLIARNTKAVSVLGIDGSEFAVDYANRNFGNEELGVRFEVGFLPECLEVIPSDSVDVVLSFETLEHVANPEALLAEFQRILAPGGRIVASVPNDWRDETGCDPNPHHLHVYNSESFRNQIAAKFDVEWFYAQSADRCKHLDAPLVWKPKPRTLIKISPSDPLQVEAEWWLAVASKSIQSGTVVPYRERYASPAEIETAGGALAFARDYENPWLIWSLVSIGARSESGEVVERWLEETRRQASEASADRGAVLCVEAYRLLLTGEIHQQHKLTVEIQKYLDLPPANPNAMRWHVSLNFVLAMMAMRSGDHAAAENFFGKVLALPAGEYSPTLLTKTSEAAWHLGHMLLSQGKTAQAAQIWRETAANVYHTLGEFMQRSAGAAMADFLSRELALVAILASRLMSASKYASIAESRPGVFFRELQGDLMGHRDWLQRQVVHLEASVAGLNQQVEMLQHRLDDQSAAAARAAEALTASAPVSNATATASQSTSQSAPRLPPAKAINQIVIREFRRLLRQGKAILKRRSA